MKRYGTIELVSDMPEAHGVHEKAEQLPRFNYCEIKSVNRREAYEAMSHGFHPQYVFVLAQAFDYHGEKQLRYDGALYNILRSYETETDSIELTAERVSD